MDFDVQMFVSEFARLLPLFAGFRVQQPSPAGQGIYTAKGRLAKAEKVYGEESPEIVPFLYNVVDSFHRNGLNDYKSGLSFLWRTCNLLRKRGDSEQPELATALTKLGEALIFTGDIKRAEPLLQQALTIRESALGSDHYLTGRTHSVIAMMEICKAQPGAGAAQIQATLTVNSVSPHALPVTAREAAGKAVESYNKLLKEQHGSLEYTPIESFNYQSIAHIFDHTERMESGFQQKLNALNDRSGGGGSCFIATAVYGDPDCWEVNQLRRFRDEKLLPNLPGSIMVRLYLAVGPTLAKWVSGRPRISAAIRHLLDGFVKRKSSHRAK